SDLNEDARVSLEYEYQDHRDPDPTYWYKSTSNSSLRDINSKFEFYMPGRWVSLMQLLRDLQTSQKTITPKIINDFITSGELEKVQGVQVGLWKRRLAGLRTLAQQAALEGHHTAPPAIDDVVLAFVDEAQEIIYHS